MVIGVTTTSFRSFSKQDGILSGPELMDDFILPIILATSSGDTDSKLHCISFLGTTFSSVLGEDEDLSSLTLL